MPYGSVFCFWCQGYIADALLECVPAVQRANPAFRLLVRGQPGAALACPYCDGLLGFDDAGQLKSPGPGWPVFRYGLKELEVKKIADGEAADVPLPDWAIRHRFIQPGSHPPLTNYTYADHAPPDETVP